MAIRNLHISWEISVTTNMKKNVLQLEGKETWINHQEDIVNIKRKPTKYPGRAHHDHPKFGIKHQSAEPVKT
jgi:hypothetical protein